MKWYEPALVCGIYALAAMTFIVPWFRAVRRLRSSGMSRDTTGSVIIHLTVALIAGAATIGVTISYGLRNNVDRTAYSVVTGGVIALLIVVTELLKLLAAERG